MDFNLDFYKGRKVLITGHTGFKGSWMSAVLLKVGADVIGYSSCSGKDTRLFDLCGFAQRVSHIKGDVQDLNLLLEVFDEYRPEIVIHMAAQPIVQEGYRDPVGTYATNVMGTVNVCEAVRRTPSVRSFVNVTTDKVYENREWVWGYRESDSLDGFDPYSNSKSCSELVTHSFQKSYFSSDEVAVSTVRAGNVIGGGDFAENRIIPDCVRAVVKGEDIVVRNPFSIRPYQHVLEPVCAYLMIAARQSEDTRLSSWYNVGPDECDCCRTGDLVDLFLRCWGEKAEWIAKNDAGPHEATLLKLDCSKIKSVFGWRARWNIDKAIEMTVDWSKVWARGEDVVPVMDRQIEEFING